jgi:hypothetical protein
MGQSLIDNTEFLQPRSPGNEDELPAEEARLGHGIFAYFLSNDKLFEIYKNIEISNKTN